MLIDVAIGKSAVPIQLFENSIVLIRGDDRSDGCIEVGDLLLPIGEPITCTPLVDGGPLDLGRDILPEQSLAIIIHDPRDPRHIEIGEVVIGSDRERPQIQEVDAWDGHPPFLRESPHPLPAVVPGQQ